MRATNNALKARVTDTARRLREVMERLALHGDELLEDSSLTTTGYEELIDRLKREIEETVLPRRLALFSEGRAVASMTVSNRRLQDLRIEGRKITTGAGLDASPDRVASVYAQALRALCTRANPLELRVTGRAENALTSSGSCSARHLSEFSKAPYFKNRLKAFLKGIHPTSRGWIFQTGDSEAVAHDADSAVFEKLVALEEKVRSEHQARNGFRHLGRNSPNLSAFSISAELQAIVVMDGQDLLVAAIPQSDLQGIMTQWNRIYCLKNASD